MNAIPTEYGGVKFRSRLESEVAFLLDTLGHDDWTYEGQSFLLPDGTHYWPDFHVPGLNLWVEVRGYKTEKGERQIGGFRRFMVHAVDALPDAYMVIRQPEVELTENCDGPEGADRITSRGAIEVGFCHGCHRGFFFSSQGSWRCRACGHYEGNAGFRVLGRGGRHDFRIDSTGHLRIGESSIRDVASEVADVRGEPVLPFEAVERLEESFLPDIGGDP